MGHIFEHDSERNGAIGDFVKLAKDRFLKIDLFPNSDFYSKGFRTNTTNFKEQLVKFFYAYKVLYVDRTNMSLPGLVDSTTNNSSQSTASSLLSVDDAKKMSIPVTQDQGTGIAKRCEHTSSIKDEWRTLPEDSSLVKPIWRRPEFDWIGELCSSCQAIDISSPDAEMFFDMDTLETNSNTTECDLCTMVYTAAKDRNLTSGGDIHQISLKRLGMDFVLKETNQKLLRLIEANPDAVTHQPPPVLELLPPKNGDPSHAYLYCSSVIELHRAWLEDCNTNHGDVCALKDDKTHVLPTRLISVAHPSKLKIIVTADIPHDPLSGRIRYVALSHKWGDMPAEAVTRRENLAQRKKKFLTQELPLSFKNAINLTIALGCTYLWIDALCILQDDDGDFAEEADKMQTTFSGAYCVLAACSAQNARDGFLKYRDPIQPEWLKIGNFFLSSVTNDFVRDVLHSPLNRRGWVLQERALARRTIYFTENQTYWECGDGVRCQTLTKLKNDKIAFLGDPNFPDYTIRPTSSASEKIRVFIDLFQQYTRLEFTCAEDRPIAIDGLMERLTFAFKTRSLAGLFETFWGHCLLWRRADDAEPLEKIKSDKSSRKIPPTWSWMAFQGAISFIEPKDDSVDWNDGGVTLPFNNLTGDQASWLITSRQNESLAIQAKAFDFEIPLNTSRSEADLYYDGGKDAKDSFTKCVIIGTDKQEVSNEGKKKHYVLIVKPITKSSGATSYERCGVGYVLGKFIRLDDSSLTVSIE
ncbi:hypothetical protein NHQ30_008856 [Ciborinia camelliae]|nr:hypothetical protein NHQ30_008856 [Ciborinia camelliae]